MRKRKYKAWDKIRKEWIKNFAISMGGEVLCSGNSMKYANVHEAEVELVEWTGLYDKNGKEIYEGDLIKNELRWGTPSECISEVVFEYAEFFGQSIRNHNIVGKGSRSIRITLAEDHASCEVIGNIYSDPHLLEHDTK